MTLTAAPAEGSVFGRWSGACEGAAPICQVTLASASEVTATFACDSDAFVTTCETELSERTTVTLALAGELNVTIKWGDGTIVQVSTPGPHTHGFGADGVYTVFITGTAPAYNSLDHGAWFWALPRPVWGTFPRRKTSANPRRSLAAPPPRRSARRCRRPG